MTISKQEKDKIRAARLFMIRKLVFFGSISMNLDLVERPEGSYAMSVDGKNIYFTPSLTEKFSFGEIVGVVLHEVYHVILFHHLRRQGRNPKKWNRACDYAINILVEETLKPLGSNLGLRLPAGALLDYTFKGMSAEQIYNLLPDEPGDNDADGESGEGEGQDGSGSGSGQFDSVEDGAEGKSEAEVEAEVGKIRSAVKNAARLASKAGQMTDSLTQLIEAICEPKASWQSLLQAYLTERAEIDFSWAKPNSRMLDQFGVIYPTLDGEKIGKIVIIVDASGSCYKDQEQFCAEVSDILGAYECEVTVIFHDVRITNIDHYTTDDLPIVMRPAGFGGTDCKTAYDHAIELDPDVIIQLTDLELDYANVPVPDCDVLVACSRKHYFKNCPDWAYLLDIS